MRRSAASALVVTALLGVWSAQAGLWQDIFRGLDLAATPTGSPVATTGDGTRVNGSRAGRLRIVPNGVIGKGYRLEFDRSFGPDSTGRAEVLNFGGLGSLTLQGGIQATAGYTQFKKLYSGTTNLIANNLNYDLKSTVGLQDAELKGTMNLQAALQVNMLGFYDLTLNASNTNSTFTLDGVLARDDKTTNFDIGPIVTKGNIFADGALAGLSSIGISPDGLLSGAFPKSLIDQITSAIDQQLQQQSVVAGATAQTDLAPLLLRTVLGQDQAAAQELTSTLVAEADTSVGRQIADVSSAVVPEPGTLLLMAAGGALVGYRRRR